MIRQKESKEETKKVEMIKKAINLSSAKNAQINWRKHTPVFGWTQMNYPCSIKPNLIEKYSALQNEEQLLLKENKIKENTTKNYNLKRKENVMKDSCFFYDNNNKQNQSGNNFRLDPEKVNEYILKGSKYYNLI